MYTLQRKTTGLILALFAVVVLAGCGADTAEPAGEVILLSYYEGKWVSPVPEAVARVEGSTVENGPDGSTHTRLTVGRRQVDLVEYGSHDKIVRRLEDTARPPLAAVMVVMGTHGVMPKQHEQLTRAKAAGVPVVAVLLSQVHMVDDQELLDLIEDPEIKGALEQAGYTSVPVVRGSAVKAVEGDAEGMASIQELVATVREHVSPLLAAN